MEYATKAPAGGSLWLLMMAFIFVSLLVLGFVLACSSPEVLADTSTCYKITAWLPPKETALGMTNVLPHYWYVDSVTSDGSLVWWPASYAYNADGIIANVPVLVEKGRWDGCQE